MFLAVGALVASAAAPACTLPTNVVFAAECSDGRTLTEGDSCVPKCRKGYLATIGRIACTMGALTASTFECVPLPRMPFPFRMDQCVPMAPADATPSMGVTTSGADVILQAGSTPATGIAQWPAVATMGHLVPVEVSFDLTATGARDGVWVVLTSGSGMTTGPTGMGPTGNQIDPTAVAGVEVDFVQTSGTGDLATPHLAAVYGSVDHTSAADLMNIMRSIGTVFDDANAHRVSILLQPVRGAIAVTTWLSGNTVGYDVTAGTAGARSMLWGGGATVWPTVVSKVTGTASVKVANFRVCGARGRQTWHSFKLVGHIRHCVETQALGNPSPMPGVWRPTKCPLGVPRIPVMTP